MKKKNNNKGYDVFVTSNYNNDQESDYISKDGTAVRQHLNSNKKKYSKNNAEFYNQYYNDFLKIFSSKETDLNAAAKSLKMGNILFYDCLKFYHRNNKFKDVMIDDINDKIIYKKL